MNGREIRMGIPCFLHGEYFKVYCFYYTLYSPFMIHVHIYIGS